MKHSFTDRDGCVVLLDGNLEAAIKYVGFAKQQIIMMLQQFGEGSYMTKSFMVMDTLIMCKIMGGHSKIYIKGSGGDAEFLHGLVSGGNIILVNEVGNIVTEAGEGVKSKLNAFYPSSDQAVFEELESREFRYEEDLAERTPADIDVFATRNSNIIIGQSGTVQPSLYSGKMRKVVQALLGKVDYQLEYRWGFYKTDGILTDSNGSDWVIRIANGIGVIATQIDTVDYSVGSDTSTDLVYDELGYVPTGDGFPTGDAFQAALESGTVIRLLSSTALNDFYSNQPFYEDCGWCFNSTGNEAQNTCWGVDGDYKRAKRYKISITISSETGKPESASIQLVDDDLLYSPGLSSKFHVPSESNTSEMKTFTMKPDDPLAAPITSSSAPIHVWYDGDSEKVVRYVISGSSATTFFPDSVVVPSSSIESRGPKAPKHDRNGTPVESYVQYPVAGNGFFFPLYSESLVSYTDIGTPAPQAVYGFDIPEHGLFEQNYTSTSVVTATMSLGGPTLNARMAFTHATVSPDSGFEGYTDAAGYNTRTTTTGSSIYKSGAVAVSPRDRSAIFFSDVESHSYSAKTHRVTSLNGLSFNGGLSQFGSNMANYYTTVSGPVLTLPGDPAPALFSVSSLNSEVVSKSVGFPVTTYLGTRFGNWAFSGGGIYFSSTEIIPPPGGTYQALANELDVIIAPAYIGDLSLAGTSETTTVSGAGSSITRRFYFLSDQTGKVDTGYTGTDIDEMYALHPTEALQLYMYLYSSQSYMKGSFYFSSKPNGTSGEDMIRMSADAEPLIECGSRVSWVGVS
jgi:hypothetical protein